MLSKYYTAIMQIQIREFKKLSTSYYNALDRLRQMNNPNAMESHTTQRYWQTVHKVEHCEKEMRVIIEELNELEDLFHWKNNLHQERFNFLTKDDNLLQKIISLMDAYK